MFEEDPVLFGKSVDSIDGNGRNNRDRTSGLLVERTFRLRVVSGPDAGKEMHAIYEFTGDDQYRICFAPGDKVALEQVERLVHGGPCDPGLFFRVAVFALWRGKWQDAASAFELALKLKPGDPAPFLRKGDALSGMKRHADALKSYEEALALAPDDEITEWLDGLAKRLDSDVMHTRTGGAPQPASRISASSSVALRA